MHTKQHEGVSDNVIPEKLGCCSEDIPKEKNCRCATCSICHKYTKCLHLTKQSKNVLRTYNMGLSVFCTQCVHKIFEAGQGK